MNTALFQDVKPSNNHRTNINQPSTNHRPTIDKSSTNHRPTINQPSTNHQPTIMSPVDINVAVVLSPPDDDRRGEARSAALQRSVSALLEHYVAGRFRVDDVGRYQGREEEWGLRWGVECSVYEVLRSQLSCFDTSKYCLKNNSKFIFSSVIININFEWLIHLSEHNHKFCNYNHNFLIVCQIRNKNNQPYD